MACSNFHGLKTTFPPDDWLVFFEASKTLNEGKKQEGTKKRAGRKEGKEVVLLVDGGVERDGECNGGSAH